MPADAFVTNFDPFQWCPTQRPLGGSVLRRACRGELLLRSFFKKKTRHAVWRPIWVTPVSTAMPGRTICTLPLSCFALRLAHERRYELWRSLGSPRYVAAPMVRQSELTFRMMLRAHGVQLTYAEPLLLWNVRAEIPAVPHNRYRCAATRPSLASIEAESACAHSHPPSLASSIHEPGLTACNCGRCRPVVPAP